ncbi:hypothetical protein [Pontimicrobium sp. MEBiC01747]|jgi:hypothetical protein
MRKIIFIVFLIPIFCQAQIVDSLSILKKNDWRTLQWFDKDTVCLLPREKIKADLTDIDISKTLRLKRQELYGERISFNENGELKYTNYMSCPVGESLKKVYSIELKNDKLIVDYESKKWPWKKHEGIRKKRQFEIIKWDPEIIILN